jgi:hypothetical protein
MKKGMKNLIVTVCIIAGVVAGASIILRIVLTKERLKAMIVPRIEERIEARIEIGDIGIRFPFGFGVRISDLSFGKDIPGTGRLELEAGRLNADASLLSLIKRKPEIKSVTIGGASLNLAGEGSGLDVEVERLAARLSMETSESSFILDPDLSAEIIRIIKRETEKVIVLPPVSFSGKVEAARDMSRVTVSGGKLSLADLAAVKIEGEIADPRGSGEFTASAVSSGLDAEKLVDLIASLDLVPALSGVEGSDKETAFAVSGGTVGLEARAAGMRSAPSEIAAAGEIKLEGIVLSAGSAPEVIAGGTVIFSDSSISSKGISLETDESRMKAAFAVEIAREEMKPRHIDFELESKVDLSEAALLMPAGGEGLSGHLKASIKGSAAPGTLRDLFPAGAAGTTPERISGAWERIDLAGTVDIEAPTLPGIDGPAGISDLDVKFSIDGGSVKILDSSMGIEGRPWKVKGELKNIMPAFSELMLLSAKGAPSSSPGRVLDAMRNSPDMSIDIKGRALDVEAMKKDDDDARDARAVESKGSETASGLQSNPLVANPLSLLVLKKTFISVTVDSVIAKGAVLTDLEAKGRISDGVLRASPVTVDYAGGKGGGRVIADLRDPSRITGDVDIEFTGIEAGKALSGFSSAGGLVSGIFAMNIGGRFAAGPGIDVLQSLSASGRATSTSGTVDLAGFMAPLKAAGLNISSIERFEFHEWTEKFSIEEGRVSSDVWRIRSESGNWDITGSFGFDGSLDYDAGLVITPAQQSRMKDLDRYGAVLDLFKDDSGNILLMLDIGGTVKQPKVRLDQSKAKEKAKKKLIEGAKDKLKDLFK